MRCSTWVPTSEGHGASIFASATKMEAGCLSETLVPTCRAAQCRNAEDHGFDLYDCDNFRSYTSVVLHVFCVWVAEVNMLIYCTRS